VQDRAIAFILANPHYLLVMDDSRNATDISLLHTDPRGLLLRHQETIRIIVKIYIESGMFSAAEFEDLVQQVNVRLWEKMPVIQANFDGSCLFRTYLSQVIRNACLNLHDKKTRQPQFYRLEGTAVAPSEEPNRKLLIEHDVGVLLAILDQFNTQRPKLVLCLKLYYRIPIGRQDILDWWPQCPEKQLQYLLDTFGSHFGDISEGELYVRLHPIFAEMERKSFPVDSLRRWVDDKIGQIVRLLNGSPPVATYDRSTLGILLEYAVSPNSLDTL
jgi:RNA polymerase sigma factor (sigma-70 family)